MAKDGSIARVGGSRTRRLFESANTRPRLHLQSGSSISGPSYYFNGSWFPLQGKWIALWLSGMRKSRNRLNKGKNHRCGPVVPGLTLRTKNHFGECSLPSRRQWVLRKYCARRWAFRPHRVLTKGPVSHLLSIFDSDNKRIQRKDSGGEVESRNLEADCA